MFEEHLLGALKSPERSWKFSFFVFFEFLSEFLALICMFRIIEFAVVSAIIG